MAVREKSGALDGLHTFPRLLFHHAKVRGDAPAMRERISGIRQMS